MLGDRQQESLILFVNFIAAFNAILKHEPTTRRLEISPRDISFLSSLSIVHVWVWFTWLQKYHYNKAPFIWLAMVTYWRKNNHELYQLIWKNLVIFDEYLLENAHISDQRQMIMTVQKKCRRPQRLHFRADKLKATFETTLQQIIIPCFHESTLTT